RPVPQRGALAQPQRPGPSAPFSAAECVVTLGRPVKLRGEERDEISHSSSRDAAVQPVSFTAQKGTDLPQPKPVADNMPGTVEAMIAGLSDPDFRVRLVSIDVLEIRGTAAVPAIPALVKALRDPNKFVRWSAARTLGKLAPRQADEVVPALMRLLN